LSVSAHHYRYLGTDEGLSSRKVISIEKDTKGYMWFLTQEGIDRYNGKHFTHYKLTTDNKHIQQFPHLNRLGIDPEGNIWISGNDGYVFSYNPMLDQYDLRLNFADTLQIYNHQPLAYTYLDKHNLWLCTKNAQYLYRTNDGEITLLDSNIKEEITDICLQGQDRYFISTNQQIYQATLEGNRLTAHTDTLLTNFHEVQHIFYHAPSQSLLVGTMMDGLYLFDIRQHTLTNIGNLKDININDIIITSSENEVLIATDGNGVFKLDMNTRTLTNERREGIVKDIYQDEEGRIWAAVYPIGIYIHTDKYPTYELLHCGKTDTDTHAGHQITYLMEDSEGDIWMTSNHGISYYSPKSKTWKDIHISNPTGQSQVFISLCESTPGTILAGGYMSGMYRIDKKNMTAHYFAPKAKEYRPDKYIRSIYRDKDGNIWAGGYYNFKQINPITGEAKHYHTDYPITAITSKNELELWVGTINGLYKFNKSQQKLQRVNLSAEIETINSIYRRNDSITYIGTNGSGLWVYNNHTEKLENYQMQNSALISNNIFCMLPSTHPDELIISTENGLALFHIREKTFLNWTKEQGLPSNRFNTAAGTKTHDGIIAFGSDDGLIVIRDSILLPRDFQSKLVFTDFNIQYQKIIPGQKDSPLTRLIDETESITLNHDQNLFSLSVSSINYDCPSRILYSWKLEGFYDEWTKPGELSLIRYTGLAPGEYTLKIRAILMDNGETIEERQLHIHILPPFSQTLGAYLLYAVLALLAIAAIVRYLWLKKSSQISKEKISFFIQTAHDIRTPLTLIKGPLSDICRHEHLSEKGKNNLDAAIQSTNRLAELATKLIDFQKEELYTSEIHVQNCELNQFLKDFLTPFHTYADKKNIRLTLEETEAPLDVWIDRNKIDSIVHNLLSNALKYTPEGGIIQVSINRRGNEWTLTVSDTGIGISTADRKKMFKHLFRGENAVNLQITGSGIGMLQTYRLVKRHFGKISVSSVENKGTTFRLSFPIRHKRYQLQPDTSPAVAPDVILPSTPTVKATTVPTVVDAPTLLIVEDNPELRHFLVQTLADTYRITEAENGQEALALIVRQQPDLILSDIMMPVMRGDDLCHSLKTNMETSHIPIILLTALGDRESILHGLEIKADNYIVKPFDIDILKASIASTLANKEFIRQRFAQLNYRTDDLPKEVQNAPGLNLDQEFLTKITDIVKNNLDKEFNVDTLCSEVGMSRSSLYNKIKALTNHSPSDFVRQIRMTEAATLLKSKKYTVAEVSDRLGYSDPKYFTDIFKKHYGMTPSAYMKQY